MKHLVTGSLVLMAGTLSAFGQGCAMCLASALSQGIEAIEALNLGILILVIPSFLVIAGILTFTFVRRFQ